MPLLVNLTLLWAILDEAAGLAPDSVLLIRQFGGDIGWALLISGTVALGWGVILRPTLTALTLRSRSRTKATTQPLEPSAETVDAVPASRRSSSTPMSPADPDDSAGLRG